MYMVDGRDDPVGQVFWCVEKIDSKGQIYRSSMFVS